MSDRKQCRSKVRKGLYYSGAAVLLVLSALVIYHLFWGRLFAWSPLKPGYRSLSFSKAVLLLPKYWPLPEELNGIDAILTDVEEFHALRFNKPVVVILARTEKEIQRFSGTRAGACAFETGTVVLLCTSKIKNNQRNIVDLLKHECSHAVLFQNTSLIKSFRIPEWLREGLAVYYGNPRDNYLGDEFLRLAVDEGYLFDILDYDAAVVRIPVKYRYGFKHSEFRCFVEYLAHRYGIQLVVAYAKNLIKQPLAEQRLFQQHFGVALEDVTREFSEAVLAKKWPPSNE
jgi:hypothetical protein